MTGELTRGLLQLFLVHLFCQGLFGLEMPLVAKNITHHDFFFRLQDVHATTQPEEFQEYNISFSGKKMKPDNLTLDDKCRLGLPLSVRWTNYGPYGSLVRPSDRSPRTGVGLAGIFPRVITQALSTCCHRNTRVETGELIATIKNLEKSLSNEDPYDVMFPVGLQSMSMTVFKDLPVVALLRAPRTTLVVPDITESGRTFQLFRTVGMAWPILAFIFLAAVLSGVFIWALDHMKNPEEFPTPFVSGVWEGFWWAVVTMTTVGYGDRAPKSILGRLFCIIWIVIGMSIIAIFTAMITASLSASIQYRFVIHGSEMGSVDGSQEERIGTGMNADIKTYRTPKDVVEALVADKTNLKVAIMDNYLLSYFNEVIEREPVRVHANLEQAINYGLVMAPNSSRLTECFRRFVRNNPQDIFDIILSNLKPLKNPTDDVSEELKASQSFLEEDAFHMILYCLAGSLAVFVVLGIIWECFISNIRHGKKQTEDKGKVRKSFFQSPIGSRLVHRPGSHNDDLRRLETIKHRSTRIRQLVQEYEEFYEKWLEKLKDLTAEDMNGLGEKVPLEKNSFSFMMVSYNGNQE